MREKLHPTEAARNEYIERNIPIGYFGEPEDVGALIAFLRLHERATSPDLRSL
jgi:3-oxoacyl-[acyl-carrier protein] reductase